MTELKSCPFCGSEASLHDGEDAPFKYRIICKNSDCLCMTDAWITKEEAIETWNRRAEIESKCPLEVVE